MKTTDEAEPIVFDDDDEDDQGGRTSIRFPYGDLDDAITVAEAVYQNFGSTGCTLRELAPRLGSTEASSAFRTKVATAKTFGVLGAARGRAELTEIGMRLADPEKRQAAALDAFLHVPLYDRLYRDYEGNTLPGDTGLENDMRKLGVKATAVQRARQVFQRSAQQAGFFHLGSNRLVKPTLRGASATPTTVKRDVPEARQQEGLKGKPAILVELFRSLPNEGDEWTAEARQLWASVWTSALDLVWPNSRPEGAKREQGNQTAVVGDDEEPF